MGIYRIPAASLGFASIMTNSNASTQLNTADARSAHTFALNLDKTLSTLGVCVGSTGGSLGANDLVCEIFAVGTDGKPTGAALASSNTLAVAIGSLSYITFTGFSLALTKGLLYAAVFKNVNGTPGTNFTYIVSARGIPMGIYGQVATSPWSVFSSTNAGSTWSLNNAGSTGMLATFSDATVLGWPSSGYGDGGSAVGVYSARKVGLRMTTPANAGLNVIGLTAFVRRTGTPTVLAHGAIRLASDDSVLGTTLELPSTLGSGNHLMLFETPIEIDPGTDIRVVLQEASNSDSSSNRYGLDQWTMRTTGAFIPWSARRTYYDGSSWAEDTGTLPCLSLALDDDAFVASGGGGGMLVHPGMGGGMRG